MIRLPQRLRRGFRALLPVLLALHLVVVQAAMAASAQPMQPSPAVAVESLPMHCHDAAPAGDASMPAHPLRHCDPGQCHCPVAMAQESRPLPLRVRLVRRVEDMLEPEGKPSLRQAPDLRPPIAA